MVNHMSNDPYVIKYIAFMDRVIIMIYRDNYTFCKGVLPCRAVMPKDPSPRMLFFNALLHFGPHIQEYVD